MQDVIRITPAVLRAWVECFRLFQTDADGFDSRPLVMLREALGIQYDTTRKHYAALLSRKLIVKDDGGRHYISLPPHWSKKLPESDDLMRMDLASRYELTAPDLEASFGHHFRDGMDVARGRRADPDFASGLPKALKVQVRKAQGREGGRPPEMPEGVDILMKQYEARRRKVEAHFAFQGKAAKPLVDTAALLVRNRIRPGIAWMRYVRFVFKRWRENHKSPYPPINYLNSQSLVDVFIDEEWDGFRSYDMDQLASMMRSKGFSDLKAGYLLHFAKQLRDLRARGKKFHLDGVGNPRYTEAEKWLAPLLETIWRAEPSKYRKDVGVYC